LSFSTVRSLGYLAALTFRRQLFSRKTLVAVGFLGFLSGLVVLVGIFDPWRPHTFGHHMVLQLLGGFFLPVAGLAYGTGALGDDRDEKSLVHLLVRAMPRSGIYLAKLLGVAPLALLLSLGGLWALSSLSELEWLRKYAGRAGSFESFWPAFFWATLAYLSLFHLFGAAFRHSTVISIAYVFFVEAFIGVMPGILKRISIQFYFHCLVYQAGEPLSVRLTRDEAKHYLPIEGDTARWVLIGLSAALLLAGAAIFARREYPDAG
jgi:ABC-2 type transport system permease protein